MAEEGDRLFRLEPLTEVNAPKIVDLVVRNFGYTYSLDWHYNPTEILRHHRENFADFIVVEDSRGDVVACIHIRFPYGGTTVAHIGLIVTDPRLTEMERAQILSLLLRQCVDRVIHHIAHTGVQLLYSTETTAHDLSQRFVRQYGMTTTGVLLSLVARGRDRLVPHRFHSVRHGHPAIATERQRYRRAETLSVYPIANFIPDYRVWIPGYQRDLLTRLYARFPKLPVTFLEEPEAPSGETVIRHRFTPSQGLATIVVDRLGADAARQVVERLHHFQSAYMESVLIQLPLTEQNGESVIAALREENCVFGGLVPHFNGIDRLVLQWFQEVAPDLREEHILDPFGREIMRTALSEWSPA